MVDKFVLGVDVNGKTAGNKAQKDINLIAGKNGYRVITYKISGGRIQQFLSKFNFKQAINKIPRESIVLLQYPLAGNLETKILQYVTERQDLFIILLIHDLDILRNPDNTLAKNIEIELLQRANSIIVHNASMKAELLKRVDNLYSKRIVELNLFDYLCDCKDDRSKLITNKTSIVIAGNLNKLKSGYVYKLGNSSTYLKYHLYGINYEGKESGNVVYHGALQPEELPQKIERGFGLVWDGEELDCCSGKFGEYLKYNNPHKLSLYIAAGIPVIVWSKAAVKDFVEREKIGFVVDSVLNIEEQIVNLSDYEYCIMRENAKRLGIKVRQGYFTKRALTKLEEGKI